MLHDVSDKPPWILDRETWDTAAVDRILAYCHDVVAGSRAQRLHRHLRRRPTPCGSQRRFQGGSGLLERVRVVLVTDDADTRDLLRLQLRWFGADAAVVTTTVATSFVVTFRPDLVLIELPFGRDDAFALARRIRHDRDLNGGRPRLVALTKHGHDHAERDALEAGFDTQIAEPVDPEGFERALLDLVRDGH